MDRTRLQYKSRHPVRGCLCRGIKMPASPESLPPHISTGDSSPCLGGVADWTDQASMTEASRMVAGLDRGSPVSR